MSENIQRTSKSTKLQNDDIDMLTNLPDSIICRILSKLETKEAVATTLLSSRFKSLWMNIDSLRFNSWSQRMENLEDGEIFENVQNVENVENVKNDENVKFAHFVNRVLILLKSKSITKFYFNFDSLSDVYDISTWCTAAICRNVKKLKVDVSEHHEADDCMFMPACLYTCKTLEVLEICSGVSLNVPEFVCLPKLTRLRLEYVKYSGDESVRRLISGCSLLEHLLVQRNEFDGVRTFTIDSPSLISLTYSFTTYKVLIERGFKFELNAPSLRYFYICDDASRDYSVFNICPLESAEVRVFSPGEADSDFHYERVVKLLQEVYNVKHLWIAGDALEALSHIPAPQTQWRCSKLIMDANDFQWSSLQEGSDKSHDIYLSKDSSDCTHVVHWKKPKELPICLLSCLETISVSGFRGQERELSMIAYILKNAQVLKKIAISVAASVTEAKFELLEKILKFDQASGRCEITFS